MNEIMSPTTVLTIWDELEADELTLLRKIQDKVREQKTEWQKLPAIAWAAERARPRHSTDLLPGKVARYGLWPVILDTPRWYADFWVDCETGEILDAKSDLPTEARLHSLRRLLGHFREIDAVLARQTLEHRYLNDRKILPDCPIPSPFIRSEALPRGINRQLVESTD